MPGATAAISDTVAVAIQMRSADKQKRHMETCSCFVPCPSRFHSTLAAKKVKH